MAVVDKNVKFIQDVSSLDMASAVRKQAQSNINGALVGGAIGVLVGIASRQNFYITGLVGLVLGRLFLSQIK